MCEGLRWFTQARAWGSPSVVDDACHILTHRSPLVLTAGSWLEEEALLESSLSSFHYNVLMRAACSSSDSYLVQMISVYADSMVCPKLLNNESALHVIVVTHK